MRANTDSLAKKMAAERLLDSQLERQSVPGPVMKTINTVCTAAVWVSPQKGRADFKQIHFTCLNCLKKAAITKEARWIKREPLTFS